MIASRVVRCLGAKARACASTVVGIPRVCCFALALPIVVLSTSEVHSQNRSAIHPSRDSAGVEIFELRSQLPTTGALPLNSVLRRELGGAAGNEGDELSSRHPMTNARVLAGGRVAVADRNAVRFYDESGKLVRTTGRAGRGPGEFGQIRAICLPRRDMIYALDQVLRRIVSISSDGAIGATTQVNRSFEFDACFSDGSIVSRSSPRVNPRSVLPPEVAREMDLVSTYERVDLNGRSIAAFGELPFETLVKHGTVVSAVVRRDSLYFAASGKPEVRLFNSAGRLVRIVRWRAHNRKTSSIRTGDSDAVGARRSSASDEVRSLPQNSGAQYIPEFAALLVDDHGNLWLEDYPIPGEPKEWTVLTGEGRVLGRRKLPKLDGIASATLVGVSDGVAVLRATDDDGFRRIVLLRLD